MRACWLKWVGRDWSISADYIWLNYSDANKSSTQLQKSKENNGSYKPIKPIQNKKRSGLNPDLFLFQT